MTMLKSVWGFLQDPTNRAVLGRIGGGIVVVGGGIWAVFKYFFAKHGPKAASVPPTVTASKGGVAAGRDIRDSKINTRGSSQR